MPRGRERILDEGKQREVCALLSAGCSLQAAAQYVACAPNTIRREAARNPDFGRRFREARLQAQLSPLQAMRKAAASHWRAAAWMLERGDPDHFARRPAPAFRPKQAQALKDDIAAILNAEIENPFLLSRVKKQIQHLIQYSIYGVVSVKRTNRQLRDVMREIDELQREADRCNEAAFDETFCEPHKGPPATSPPATSDANSNRSSQGTASSAPGTAESGPTSAEQPSNPSSRLTPSSSAQRSPTAQRLGLTWPRSSNDFAAAPRIPMASQRRTQQTSPQPVDFWNFAHES